MPSEIHFHTTTHTQLRHPKTLYSKNTLHLKKRTTSKPTHYETPQTTNTNTHQTQHTLFHPLTYSHHPTQTHNPKNLVFGILYNNCDHLNTTNPHPKHNPTTRNRITITHATCHNWYPTRYKLKPKTLHASRTSPLQKTTNHSKNIQLQGLLEIHTFFDETLFTHLLQSKSI